MTTLLILCLASGVLLMLLSLPMLWGKIPPNGLYGFWVRATLDNPDLWHPANKHAAKRCRGQGRFSWRLPWSFSSFPASPYTFTGADLPELLRRICHCGSDPGGAEA